MRILKGYSKEERKELEKVKEIGINDFLHIITGFTSDTRFGLIWEKYDKSEQDEGTSIIKDIADFYCGNAKFPVQMYRVTLPDGNYLVRDKIDGNRWMFTYSDRDGYNITHSSENSFTEQEIKDIDPRYMAFAVPVEADDD